MDELLKHLTLLTSTIKWLNYPPPCNRRPSPDSTASTALLRRTTNRTIPFSIIQQRPLLRIRKPNRRNPMRQTQQLPWSTLPPQNKPPRGEWEATKGVHTRGGRQMESVYWVGSRGVRGVRGCGGYLTSNIQIIRRITEYHPCFHPRNNPSDMWTGHTCSGHDCGCGIWSEGVG